MQEKQDFLLRTAARYLGCGKGDELHRELLSIYNLGIRETDPGQYDPAPRSHVMRTDEAWCAAFVSAIGLLCGLEDFPLECSCNRQIAQLKTKGLWEEADDYRPQPGDLIYYDWQDTGKGDNTGVADHVGIVEKITSDNLTVIEGNLSGRCARRKIKINGRYIRGFGKTAPTGEASLIAPSDFPYAATVTPSNGLNVRTGPGVSFQKRGALKCGSIITVTDEDAGWGQIEYKGKPGWVCLEYVKQITIY